MYKNQLCLIWKSERVSFRKEIEVLNLNFKIVDHCVSDKQVKSFIGNEYKLEKVQPQITNMIVYD